MSSPSGPSPPPRRATTVRARAAETAPRDPRSERMRRGETEDWQNGRSVLRHTGRTLLGRVYPAAPQHSATCATHHAIAHQNKGVSRAHETWSRISRQARLVISGQTVCNQTVACPTRMASTGRSSARPLPRESHGIPQSRPPFPVFWCSPANRTDPTERCATGRQRIQTKFRK